MEDQTTPETPVQQTDNAEGSDRGSASTEELVPEAPAEDGEQPAEGSEQETQDSASSDEVETWAKTQNLDLSNQDDVKKLAQRFRDTQKSLHETKKETSDLRKSVSTVSTPDPKAYDEFDPLVKEVQQLKDTVRQQQLQQSVDRFYMDNPDARTLDNEMAAILEKKPWLANDLDSLYIVTKAQNNIDAVAAAKEQGKSEALTSVARRASASAPSTSASTGQTAKELTDADIANMSLADYKAQRESILKDAGIPLR